VVEIVDGRDVGVVEPGKGERLVAEPLPRRGVREGPRGHRDEEAHGPEHDVDEGRLERVRVLEEPKGPERAPQLEGDEHVEQIVAADSRLD